MWFILIFCLLSLGVDLFLYIYLFWKKQNDDCKATLWTKTEHVQTQNIARVNSDSMKWLFPQTEAADMVKD